MNSNCVPHVYFISKYKVTFIPKNPNYSNFLKDGNSGLERWINFPKVKKTISTKARCLSKTSHSQQTWTWRKIRWWLHPLTWFCKKHDWIYVSPFLSFTNILTWAPSLSAFFALRLSHDSTNSQNNHIEQVLPLH